MANEANDFPDTDEWHTDLIFKQNPAFASILVARYVPEVGGDTLSANMYAAYEALDDDIESYLKTLSAIHDISDFGNTFGAGETDGKKLLESVNRFGCTINPVIKTHQVSGRKFLYANESFTQHIVGLTARESRKWLNWLLDHITQPDYQVRLCWQNRSVAMWDSHCTQRYAVTDYLPAYRCMNRVTVVKDRRTNA